MELFIFLLLVMGITALIRSFTAHHRLKELKKDVEALRAELKNKPQTVSVPVQRDIPAVPVQNPQPREVEVRPFLEPPVAPAEALPPSSTEVASLPRVPRQPVLDFLFQNVLGLAGALLALAGLIYLGYLGIFSLGPFWKDLGLGILGLGFAGVSLFLPKSKNLRQPGDWFQAMGGALMVVSAVGAMGIPGLQWLEFGSPLGWTLVLLALGANIALAAFSKIDGLISLHGLFCFAALLSAPAQALTLIAASGLILSLGGLALWAKAPFHLLFTGVLATVYFLYWQAASGTGEFPLALALSTLVFHFYWVLALSPRYRSLQSWKPFSLMSGLMGAVYFSAAIFMVPKLHYLSLFYGLSFVVLILQLWGFRKVLRPRFKTLLTVLSMVSGLLALLFLTAWEWGELPLFSVMGLYALGWQLVASRGGLSSRLSFASVLVQGISWVGLVLSLVFRFWENGPQDSPDYFSLFLYLLPFTSLLAYSPKFSSPTEKDSSLGKTFFSLLAGVSWIAAVVSPASPWGFVPLILGIILGASPWRRFMNYSRESVTAGLLVLGIQFLLLDKTWVWEYTALWSVATLTWGLLLYWKAPGGTRKVKTAGVSMALLGLGSLPFFLLTPHYPFTLGPLWMFLGVVLKIIAPWESSSHRGRDIQLPWSWIPLVPVSFFILHHALVVLQSPLIWDLGFPLTHTGISAGLGSTVLLWFLLQGRDRTHRVVKIAFLASLALLLMVEFRSHHLALVFSLLALGLWTLGKHGGENLRGLDAGGLLFHLASLFFLITLSFPLKIPVRGYLPPSWEVSLSSMVLQGLFTFLLLRYQGVASLFSPEREKGFIRRFQGWGPKAPVLALALGVGFYLFWASEGLIQDLGWLLEGFLLFGMGLLLKEKWLHYVSLGAVAATLAKLVIADFSSNGELARVLFIIFSGGILMTMSVLYRKFGDSKK